MAFDATEFLADLLPGDVHETLVDLQLDRINELRRHLWAENPDRFNMHHWVFTQKDTLYTRQSYLLNKAPASEVRGACDTVACIGGWIDILFTGQNEKPHRNEEWAAAAVGLDYETAEELFYPNPVPQYRWGEITPRMAVGVIDELVRTGEVDWAPVKRQLEGVSC